MHKAVQKAISLKHQKIQSKIDRCKKDKKFLDDVSCNPLVGILFCRILSNMPYKL